jgi:hypothetical protein
MAKKSEYKVKSLRDQFEEKLAELACVESYQRVVKRKVSGEEVEVPTHFEERNELADWCSDVGLLPEHEALIWCVQRRKRPGMSVTNEGLQPGAFWFNADTIAEGLGDEESNLPSSLWEKLQIAKPEDKVTDNQKKFETFFQAEKALLAAFRQWDGDESDKRKKE